MSATSSSARARSLLHERVARPRLAAVAGTRPAKRRVPFAALVITVLTLGMVGLLIVNTSLQRTAFVVTSLRDRAAALSLREQSLKVQVLRLQSPQRLAAVAAADGMVHVDSPSFLSLKSGKVTGPAHQTAVANPPEVYGGRRTAGGGKVPVLAAGSANSANTGLRHEAPTAPSPRGRTSSQSSASSTSDSAGRSQNSHRHSGANGRTQ
jgi:hypothetical protein